MVRLDTISFARFAASSPRVAGWASLALGALLIARPVAGRAVGMGEDRRVLAAVAATDLALAAGLLQGGDPARWMAARALANVAIGGLCARTIASDPARRGPAAAMLALLLGLTIMDGAVARQLRASAPE